MLKKNLLLFFGVAGTVGLVAVMRYHPKPLVVGTVAQHAASARGASTPSPTMVAVASVTPTPAAKSPTPSPTPASTPRATATPTPTPVATHTPMPTPTPTPSGPYHNGTYTGSTATAIGYGQVQVRVTISGGYISGVTFLQMPSGGNSTAVTNQAEPILLSETLQTQSAAINTVTGATQTTDAYKTSLASALAQA